MPVQSALPPKPAKSTTMEDRARYIHEYVTASVIKEERRILGLGAPEEYASKYPERQIQTHLNKRASEGWRLVIMEPHWYYGRQYISAAMSITRPLAIIGWYLTFERVD